MLVDENSMMSKKLRARSLAGKWIALSDASAAWDDYGTHRLLERLKVTFCP